MIPAHHVKEWHRILKMDSSPARYQWARGYLEADFVCHERRRELLARAGCPKRWADTDWDALPASVREKLGAA